MEEAQVAARFAEVSPPPVHPGRLACQKPKQEECCNKYPSHTQHRLQTQFTSSIPGYLVLDGTPQLLELCHSNPNRGMISITLMSEQSPRQQPPGLNELQ